MDDVSHNSTGIQCHGSDSGRKKTSLETGSGNEGSIQLSNEKHPLTYHGILFSFIRDPLNGSL